jgi:hypothetical protein
LAIASLTASTTSLTRSVEREMASQPVRELASDLGGALWIGDGVIPGELRVVHGFPEGDISVCWLPSPPHV